MKSPAGSAAQGSSTIHVKTYLTYYPIDMESISPCSLISLNTSWLNLYLICISSPRSICETIYLFIFMENSRLQPPEYLFSRLWRPAISWMSRHPHAARSINTSPTGFIVLPRTFHLRLLAFCRASASRPCLLQTLPSHLL